MFYRIGSDNDREILVYLENNKSKSTKPFNEPKKKPTGRFLAYLIIPSSYNLHKKFKSF